ncbi:MAG TPA: Uma2 family endonuclease [Chthonomonadaceae bacterium]|nr:Uma2 family endonuclease [Chthonomonadaceae bacterium]
MFNLPKDGYLYELVRGELCRMAPPSAKHGSTTARLFSRAGIYIEDNDLGEAFTSETGFLLAQDPDTVLAPDFAFIAKERLPEPLPDTYIPVVPDLVLETRSHSDTRRRVNEKVALWPEFGAKIVWELDPRKRVLTVYRSGVEPRTWP